MLEGYLNAQPARIFFPDSNNLRITEVYKRFGRGCKPRPTLGWVIWLQDGGLSLPWRKGFLC